MASSGRVSAARPGTPGSASTRRRCSPAMSGEGISQLGLPTPSQHLPKGLSTQMAASPSHHLPLHGPPVHPLPSPPPFGVQGAGMKSVLLPATASAMWGPYQRAVPPAAGMARAQRKSCQLQSRRRPGEAGMARGVVDTPILRGDPGGAMLPVSPHLPTGASTGPDSCGRTSPTSWPRAPTAQPCTCSPSPRPGRASRAQCHARHGDLPHPPLRAQLGSDWLAGKQPCCPLPPPPPRIGCEDDVC